MAGPGARGGWRRTPALLALACILVVAKLGGELALRAGQAAVLGELLGGVLLGNLDLLGLSQLEWIGADTTVDIFARLGMCSAC